MRTGPISPMLYELMNEISWKFFSIQLQFQWLDQVTILHMSLQLGCREICKIVTISNHYFSQKSSTIFTSFRFWAQKPFVQWFWGSLDAKAMSPDFLNLSIMVSITPVDVWSAFPNGTWSAYKIFRSGWVSHWFMVHIFFVTRSIFSGQNMHPIMNSTSTFMLIECYLLNE